MARVWIEQALKKEIKAKFKSEAKKVAKLLYSLKNNPKKGKYIGAVNNTAIREIKYKNFRFYYITDGYALKIYNEKRLANLLIRFVRMSDKKEQQKVIDEIKEVLRNLDMAW